MMKDDYLTLPQLRPQSPYLETSSAVFLTTLYSTAFLITGLSSKLSSSSQHTAKGRWHHNHGTKISSDKTIDG